MTDIRYRLMGIVFFIGSIGSTLVHRQAFEAARRGPAQVIELGLALLTFILASAGILLLVHGAKLLRSGCAIPGARTVDRAVLDRGDTSNCLLDDAVSDGRGEIGKLLAWRAIAAADSGAVPPEKKRNALDRRSC